MEKPQRKPGKGAYQRQFVLLNAEETAVEIHSCSRWVVAHAPLLGGQKVAGKWLFRLDKVLELFSSGKLAEIV